MYTNTNMSIFNKYVNPSTKTITFKKHLIDNAFWVDTKNVQQNKGYDKNNRVVVYVPKNKNDLTSYVKTNNYVGTGWTIQDGDFIIRGTVTETEISGVKDLAAYEVFIIKSFSDKDYGSKDMHHFEIKGD